MKLNLCCGRKPLKGYINCDMRKLDGVDKVFNIEQTFPFYDNIIDEVRADAALEHVSNIFFTMNEIHRILKSTGKLIGYVPYYHSNQKAHPDHKSEWGLQTFDFFRQEHYNNYYTDRHWKNIKLKLIPTRLGSIIPNLQFKYGDYIGLRHMIADVLGEVIRGIAFEMEPIK